MLNYPDSIVITVDDDIEYTNDLVEILLNSYRLYPYAVSAKRVRLIKLNSKGEILPYKDWGELCHVVGVPSMALLATGVGGVLYPPHCMNNQLFNKKNMFETSLYTDDLWLKVMQLLSNTPVVLADESCKLNYIENTQEVALYKTNINQSVNDINLKKVLLKYSSNENGNKRLVDKLKTSYVSFCLYEKSKPSILLEDIKLTLGRKSHLERELYNIKHGYSFRIGRIITFFPRKIRGGVRCYREHGLKYTVRRTLYHMGLYKW